MGNSDFFIWSSSSERQTTRKQERAGSSTGADRRRRPPRLLQEAPVFSVAPEKSFRVLAPKATLGSREARADEKPCPGLAEQPRKRDRQPPCSVHAPQALGGRCFLTQEITQFSNGEQPAKRLHWLPRWNGATAPPSAPFAADFPCPSHEAEGFREQHLALIMAFPPHSAAIVHGFKIPILGVK